MRKFVIRGWLKGIAYFGFGTWLRAHAQTAIEWSMPRPMSLALLGAGWAILAIDAKSALYIGLPLAIAGVWYTLRGLRLPKILVGCAFPVYVLHAFWSTAAYYAFRVLESSGYVPDTAAKHGTFFIVMLFGSIAAAHLLRRFAPRFSAIVFGGR